MAPCLPTCGAALFPFCSLGTAGFVSLGLIAVELLNPPGRPLSRTLSRLALPRSMAFARSASLRLALLSSAAGSALLLALLPLLLRRKLRTT